MTDRSGIGSPSLEPAGRIRTLWSTGWPIGALIALYLLVDLTVRGLTDLGEAGYRSPSLILELLTRSGFAVLALLAAWSLAVWRTGALRLRWPGFDRGWSFRLPAGTAIAALTWWYSAYDYNLFLDRGHWIDRAALIVLAGLALWRPVFTVPWVFLVATIMHQFQYPIGGFSVAEQFQLVRVVELLIAAMIIRLATGRWRNGDYLLAIICLVAGGFFVPGVGKVRLGWLTLGAHVELNLFSAYTSGWLGMLSVETLETMLRILRPLAWPMLIGTAVIELGAVLILWSRRTLLVWLGLFVALHLGVVALTGIFFWRWVALELALIVFLLRDRLIDSLPIFTRSHALLATGLVIVAPLWAMPVNLAWLDAPVTYAYRFVAADAAGNTARLSAQFFRPYDYQFSLGAFDYLSSEPRVFPHFWGDVGNRDLLRQVYAARSPAVILALESDNGVDLFDGERAAALDDFIRTTVSNWNRRGSPGGLWSVLRAPAQLWTVDPDAFAGNGPIESVTVVQVLAYWDGDRYRELRTVPIRHIEIAHG